MRKTIPTVVAVSFALAATAATAAGSQPPPTVSPGAEPTTSRPLSDLVAEKKASPYYRIEAYLRLKPQRQDGDHFEMPALLANGRCSDPAGEGR